MSAVAQINNPFTSLVFYRIKGSVCSGISTNITNSLTVECKGQSAFTIDFKDSPKWLITTNYVIKGEGSSFDRRRHVVEFSDYYNQHPKPIEEFGRRLFDWPDEEWIRFDNFMLRCLKLYLTRGLQEVQVNYKERLLLQNTSEEFVSFMESLEFEVEYNVKELKNIFSLQYEDFNNDKTFTMRTFCNWIRLYLNHKQITCHGDETAGNKATGNKNRPFEERNGNKYLKMVFS